MPDEKNFTPHILDIEEALGNLCLTEGGQKEAHVLRMAHNLWTMTKKRLEGEAEVGKTLREIDVHEK